VYCVAGEDNKKVLLDLGAVEHFLRLLQHDDRIVRRNACMVFGLMTSHGELITSAATCVYF